MASVTRLALYGGIAAPYAFELFEGPNAFAFTAQSGIALSAANVTSETVVLGGISESLVVTLGGDGSAEYSKNGGGWSTAATTAVNGDTFALRVDASASYNTPVSAVLTVGTITGTFTVRTLRDPSLAQAATAKITRLHARR